MRGLFQSYSSHPSYRVLSRGFAVLLLCSSPLRAASTPAPSVTLEQGEIAGAKFTLARPAHWNGRVLLLAHGLRDADRPLVADLFPANLACRTLLDEGWIVAKTSYRRNGPIVADAIADLDALRDHIEKKFGTPERILLEGEAMGGLIATLIAEREPEDPRLYAGAVAIGAVLSLQEKGAARGVSLEPRTPLLFLANQNELEASRAYVTSRLRPADYPSELRPVLFRISRDGHVNVNQRERLAALRALNAWLDSGRATLPQPGSGESGRTADLAPIFDATIAPEPSPSQVTPHADGRGFDARVTECSAVDGLVSLNAQSADLAAAGIGKMTWFQLTVRDQTWRVRYGRNLDSVKRGEWVALLNADGFTWLARNFADAAATARLAVGDPVTLRRYDEPK